MQQLVHILSGTRFPIIIGPPARRSSTIPGQKEQDYTMRKNVLLAVVLLAVFALVPKAHADGLQIGCTGATVCSPGGIETTTNTNPTFDVSLVGNGSGNESGELWIAVLTPVTSGANFTG